jgi:hypothetical protein
VAACAAGGILIALAVSPEPDIRALLVLRHRTVSRQSSVMGTLVALPPQRPRSQRRCSDAVSNTSYHSLIASPKKPGGRFGASIPQAPTNCVAPGRASVIEQYFVERHQCAVAELGELNWEHAVELGHVVLDPLAHVFSRKLLA